MKQQTVEEYVEERKIARATVKQKVFIQPPLEATKEYRYIAPPPTGLSLARSSARTGADTRHVKARKSSAEKKGKRPKTIKNPSTTTRGTAKINRIWSDEQRKDIVTQHNEGKTWSEIAAQYGATKDSVRCAARLYKED